MRVKGLSLRILSGLFASVFIVGCYSWVGDRGAEKSLAFDTPLVKELSRVTTDRQADEINPVWSHDGSTLFYVQSKSFRSEYDIWEMDLRSRMHVNLTESFSLNAHNPTWSPDGRRMAFFSREGAIYTIWNMDTAAQFSSQDRRFTKLTDGKHMDVFPAWSPDGQKIAFVSDRSGEAAVWTMKSDGGEPVRLTEGGFGDLTPAWSPDGASLAFTRRVQMELDQNEKEDYRETLDELTQITHSGQLREKLYQQLDQAFDLPGRIRVSHLYVLNVGSGRLQQLSFDEMEDGRPVWSPDGSTLAFSSKRNGNMDLWLINADGTNLRRLTSHPAEDRYPAWSPDGKQIAFASDRAGSADIWVLALREEAGQ